MIQHPIGPRGLFILLSLAVLAPATWALMNGESEKATEGLSPSAEQKGAAEEIVDRLDSHYRELSFNDELSARVWQNYLDNLDPNRVYFTRGDIDSFRSVREQLDDQLADGELSAGFDIFRVYRQRMDERLNYLLGRLDEGLDSLSFDQEETLRVDRADAPWPEDEAALHDLWRRRLKNAVLSMRLNDVEDDDIVERLRRRYEGQRNRMKQNTSEDVFQIYINALTQTYDPHTSYFTPHRSENFDISMSRSLEGIGAVLQSEDEYTKVIRLVPGGPAAKNGRLHPADRIVGVAQGEDGDMENVISMRLDEVVDKIRGPKGSIVRLKVIPHDAANDHDTREVSIERNKVELKEQAASKEILELGENDNRRIGVIRIPAFYMDFEAARRGDPDYASTTRDVAQLIMELKDEDLDGLMVDLRDNSGGSLQEAIKLVSLFIDSGPTVQVRDNRNDVQVESDQLPGALYRGPMAVLVNRYSASASEIFAGAMQDYGRALVVGGQTFGKGTVQSLMELNHGELKMTQAKFYRVSGASNQHRGILPDLQLPYAVDKTQIGESALDNALPWDVIDAADYDPVANLDPLMPRLREAHKERMKDNPEFDYVRSQIDLIETSRERERVTLHAEKRRERERERDEKRLAIENELREHRGKEPVESMEELEELREEEAMEAARNPDSEREGPDPHLREAARILSDLADLSGDQGQVAGRA